MLVTMLVAMLVAMMVAMLVAMLVAILFAILVAIGGFKSPLVAINKEQKENIRNDNLRYEVNPMTIMNRLIDNVDATVSTWTVGPVWIIFVSQFCFFFWRVSRNQMKTETKTLWWTQVLAPAPAPRDADAETMLMPPPNSTYLQLRHHLRQSPILVHFT